ncbi:hypothetical protein D9M70_638200 [compost metagenome]
MEVQALRNTARALPLLPQRKCKLSWQQKLACKHICLQLLALPSAVAFNDDRFTSLYLWIEHGELADCLLALDEVQKPMPKLMGK